MGPKKKNKKVEEKKQEPTDQLSAVDRQFYELTITDINRKLATLRTRNVTLEDRAEELEAQIKEMEEDRTDVTAYLNRKLRETMSKIEELEDQLTELSKVRLQENVDCRNKMSEWEIKYKAMYEQLTSEIKLLTGKLNSMEEFRLQRDELLAKFDCQETEIKEQNKKHKDKLYELEIKFMADKFRLKKEVERRLLELSIDFRKYNEVKVASHTQRMVRENISLNNEMDRMMYTQSRLQWENREMKLRDQIAADENSVDQTEKDRLIKTCRTQLDIIEQLTTKYEELVAKNCKMEGFKRKFHTTEKNFNECQKMVGNLLSKVALLEQNLQSTKSDRFNLAMRLEQEKMLFNKVFEIVKKIRFTIDSVVSGQQGPYEDDDDPDFYEAQRENLIQELLLLVNEFDSRVTHKPSLPSITSVQEIYQQGDFGMVPTHSVESYTRAVRSEMLLESIKGDGSQSTVVSDRLRLKRHEEITSDNIIDVISGSKTIIYDSAKKLVKGEEEDEDEASVQSSELYEDEEDEMKMAPVVVADEPMDEPKAGTLEAIVEEDAAVVSSRERPSVGPDAPENGEIVDVAHSPTDDAALQSESEHFE